MPGSKFGSRDEKGRENTKIRTERVDGANQLRDLLGLWRRRRGEEKVGEPRGRGTNCEATLKEESAPRQRTRVRRNYDAAGGGEEDGAAGAQGVLPGDGPHIMRGKDETLDFGRPIRP